jgi:hypothetical protein
VDQGAVAQEADLVVAAMAPSVTAQPAMLPSFEDLKMRRTSA